MKPGEITYPVFAFLAWGESYLYNHQHLSCFVHWVTHF